MIPAIDDGVRRSMWSARGCCADKHGRRVAAAAKRTIHHGRLFDKLPTSACHNLLLLHSHGYVQAVVRSRPRLGSVLEFSQLS